MLLDDLVTAIQSVQARIREHINSLSQNEYRTRISLIDPVLNALGWDVSDPTSVTLEHQLGSRRADYALLDEDGKPRVFIEAKRLGENLESEEFQEQVFTYALMQKLKYVGLTDGNRWILEDLQARLNGGESRILDITLSTETSEICARRIQLRGNGVLLFEQAGNPREESSSNGSQPESGTKKPDSPSVDIEQSFSEGWISLANSRTFGNVSRVSQMHIPDKGVVQLSDSSEFELMVETAEWLIREGALNSRICPVSRIEGKPIVDSVVRPLYGSLARHKLSNGLYLNKTSWHIMTLLKEAKFLIKYCGQDPTAILLKPSQ